MFFLPFAIMVKSLAPESLWTAIGQTPAAYPGVTWAAFIGNLVPVTIGNMIGGGVFVGAVYWLICIRHGLQHGAPHPRSNPVAVATITADSHGEA